MGHYDEALADFNQVTDLLPQYAWAIGSRGQTYRLLGREQEAQADFARARELELEPAHHDYARKRAEIHQLMGKAPEVWPGQPQP